MASAYLCDRRDDASARVDDEIAGLERGIILLVVKHIARHLRGARLGRVAVEEAQMHLRGYLTLYAHFSP